MTHRRSTQYSEYIMERKADKASRRPSSSPAPPARSSTTPLSSTPGTSLRPSSKCCAHAFLAYPVRKLVLPNSSPEDADIFRIMLQRVNVIYLLRLSSGNSESARLCTLTIRKGAQPACVSSSCNKMTLTSSNPMLSTFHRPRSGAGTHMLHTPHTLWAPTYAVIVANHVWAMTWSAGTSASPSTSTASGSSTLCVGLGRRTPTSIPFCCAPPLFLLPAQARPFPCRCAPAHVLSWDDYGRDRCRLESGR
ncbi:hypothetical protein B0H13DRAFT_796213 [Mycena leptocephala]|nr:hypothetical protein B0H13DRAFT_796213 [Mycena leptocephala]